MSYKIAPESLWTGPAMMGCGPVVKAIYAYLCTKKQLHVSGINYIHPATIAGETSWDLPMVEKALSELEEKGLIHYDRKCSVIFVPEVGRENIRSPKLIPNVLRHLNSLYGSELIKTFLQENKHLIEKHLDTLSDTVLDTLSDTVLDTLNDICILSITLKTKIYSRIKKESGKARPSQVLEKKETGSADDPDYKLPTIDTCGAGEPDTGSPRENASPGGLDASGAEKTGQAHHPKNGRFADQYHAWLDEDLRRAKILPVHPGIAIVIAEVNAKYGSNFSASTIKTLRHMTHWVRRGVTGKTFLTVYARKYSQWRGDGRMAQHINPQTIFGENFEKYVNELPPPPNHERVKELAAAAKNSVLSVSDRLLKQIGISTDQFREIAGKFHEEVENATAAENLEMLEELAKRSWPDYLRTITPAEMPVAATGGKQ